MEGIVPWPRGARGVPAQPKAAPAQGLLSPRRRRETWQAGDSTREELQRSVEQCQARVRKGRRLKLQTKQQRRTHLPSEWGMQYATHGSS